MLQTIEATIDHQGKLKFSENIHWRTNQRVLVTFLEEQSNICSPQNYTLLMQQLNHVKAGRTFTRDELNER
jgi:hypothetical protein